MLISWQPALQSSLFDPRAQTSMGLELRIECAAQHCICVLVCYRKSHNVSALFVILEIWGILLTTWVHPFPRVDVMPFWQTGPISSDKVRLYWITCWIWRIYCTKFFKIKKKLKVDFCRVDSSDQNCITYLCRTFPATVWTFHSTSSASSWRSPPLGPSRNVPHYRSLSSAASPKTQKAGNKTLPVAR